MRLGGANYPKTEVSSSRDLTRTKGNSSRQEKASRLVNNAFGSGREHGGCRNLRVRADSGHCDSLDLVRQW